MAFCETCLEIAESTLPNYGTASLRAAVARWREEATKRRRVVEERIAKEQDEKRARAAWTEAAESLERRGATLVWPHGGKLHYMDEHGKRCGWFADSAPKQPLWTVIRSRRVCLHCRQRSIRDIDAELQKMGSSIGHSEQQTGAMLKAVVEAARAHGYDG
jgi:hypothetical protein